MKVTVSAWPIFGGFVLSLILGMLGVGGFHPATTFALATGPVLFALGYMRGGWVVANKYVFKDKNDRQ